MRRLFEWTDKRNVHEDQRRKPYDRRPVTQPLDMDFRPFKINTGRVNRIRSRERGARRRTNFRKHLTAIRQTDPSESCRQVDNNIILVGVSLSSPGDNVGEDYQDRFLRALRVIDLWTQKKKKCGKSYAEYVISTTRSFGTYCTYTAYVLYLGI